MSKTFKNMYYSLQNSRGSPGWTDHLQVGRPLEKLISGSLLTWSSEVCVNTMPIGKRHQQWSWTWDILEP